MILNTVCLISCRDKPAKSQEAKIDTSTFDSHKMVEKLQGEWKESEYPFRRAAFNKSTVKFTEEGVAEEPVFKKFEISIRCPFAMNESKNTEPNGNFIVMTEDKTCQEIEITGDSLIFSGFNKTTYNQYHIVYKKLK